MEVFTITETIAVALITMASGVLGATLTSLISWQTTKLSARKELKRNIREEKKHCFSQLISAYDAFLIQFVINDDDDEDKSDHTANTTKELELLAQFKIAYECAILICDQTSLEPFSVFFNQVSKMDKTKDYVALNAAYINAVNAMRKELREPQNYYD